MPAHHGLGLDEDQDVTPAGPDAAQDGPEEPVETVYGRPWSFPLQDRDLLPEGEDLEGGVPATTEEHAYYSQD